MAWAAGAEEGVAAGAGAGVVAAGTGAGVAAARAGVAAGGLIGAGTVVGLARRCSRTGRLAAALRSPFGDSAGAGRRLATVLFDSGATGSIPPV